MNQQQIEKFKQWFLKQRKKSGRRKGAKHSRLTLDRYIAMLQKVPDININKSQLALLKELQIFINDHPPFYCFCIKTYLRMLETEDIDNRIKINTIRINLKSPPIGASVITNLNEAKKKRLSKEIIREFVNVSRNVHEKLIVTLLYDTACRISELLGLQKSNVNFNNNTLFIEKGKGGESRYVMFEKSTSPMLKEYLQKRKEEKLFSLTATGAYFLIKRLAEKVNVNIKDRRTFSITPHWFRHTRLTHLAEIGWTAERLQSYAGWTDIKTTDIYIRMNKEAIIGYDVYKSTDLWED